MISRGALASSLVLGGLAVAADAQTPPWPTEFPVPPSTIQGAGMVGNSPACIADFIEHRTEVQKRALSVKFGSENRVARNALCELIQGYVTAEAKWIKYSEDNMIRCGIPKDTIDRMKVAHAGTIDVRAKICEAGSPRNGPPELREQPNREKLRKYQRFAGRGPL